MYFRGFDDRCSLPARSGCDIREGFVEIETVFM
jgi:hypothetical protein